MAIYLGDTLLTGSGSSGGGFADISGLSYFTPAAGTTFVDGQEVYTNPVDDSIWIRSGAQITDSGSGVLDASDYRDAVTTFGSTGTTRSLRGGAAATRGSLGFNGAHIFAVGLDGTSFTTPRNATGATATNPDGTNVFSFGSGTDGAGFSDNDGSAHYVGQAFYNTTHTFQYISAGDWYVPTTTVIYSPTNTLTNLAAYNTAFTSNVRYTTPSIYGVCTNPGSDGTGAFAAERFWFGNGTTLTEYTFDSTAGTGTNPFTATGETITLASAVNYIAVDGNIIYVQSGTNLIEVNATTRTVIRTLTNVPSRRGSGSLGFYGLIVIPAANSASGGREFWFPTSESTSAGGNSRIVITSYEESEVLTAPHGGAYSAPGETNTRTPITLKQQITAGSTLTTETVHDGRGSAEDPVYLWMRIA